jgi:magnesium transporter
MRLKVCEDEDFSVLNQKLWLFSDYTKSLELLEQIEQDMGLLESASNFFSSQS